MHEGTLVLFCKPPERSKRRLVPALGETATAELANHLLHCALEDAAQWPGPLVLSPAREEDRAWASRLPVAGAEILPQSEGNLGERLNDIDLRLRDEGHETLLFIGLDCPLLDETALSAALAALRKTDIVLGDASDGGVVYMGNARPWPPLAELPWSTAALAETLAGACRSAGLGVHRGGVWQDIDRIADLAPLAAALEGDRRPARRALRQWLNAGHGENGTTGRQA